MYSTLSDKIYEKLQAISGINTLTKYEQNDLQNFPGVSILEADTDAIIEDIVSYTFITRFTIRVIDSAESRSDTCENMRSLVDQIIATIIDDPTFGVVGIAKLDVNAKWGWAESDVPARVCDISLAFTKNIAI